MKQVVQPRGGFTLVEIVVSILLVTMMATGLVRSVLMARDMSYSSTQRVSAYALAKAALEEARSVDYASLTPANFPAETGIALGHLGGRTQQALLCDRSVQFLATTNPVRTDVSVQVSWQFRGTALQESVQGVIYP